ncbi:hypothetical protein D6833_07285 [Candidatus Parcubacteria bacterium]|nr:MAG: hypothetical protein D6833_07285 [Candidatus Parcubacteria bacterium]
MAEVGLAQPAPCLREAARPVRRHRESILAYISERLTNSIVEGINTRLQMVARKAFGFHSPQALVLPVLRWRQAGTEASLTHRNVRKAQL